jgi:hypothetical protein
MAGPFDRDTAVRRIGPTRFQAEVAPSWSTARGPHGGYLAAIALRAMLATLDEPERSARSFTIHFARPPRPGPVEVEVEVERAGRSLSTLTARMHQDDKLIALVLGAFSKPWPGHDVSELEMPAVAPPEPDRHSGERLAMMGPHFMRHLVVQPRIGSKPFSGEGAMTLGGWLGFSEPRVLDAIALVFFCDAWLPSLYVRLERFQPVPTVDLTVHFRSSAPRTDPAELLLAKVDCRLIQEGFFEEDCVLWAPDGTVLAQSRQLGIVMGPEPRA